MARLLAAGVACHWRPSELGGLRSGPLIDRHHSIKGILCVVEECPFCVINPQGHAHLHLVPMDDDSVLLEPSAIVVDDEELAARARQLRPQLTPQLPFRRNV